MNRNSNYGGWAGISGGESQALSHMYHSNYVTTMYCRSLYKYKYNYNDT